MTSPLPPPSGLRLASYNVRKGVGLDRRRDPGRILSVVDGLQADIVALQEADRRLGARHSVFDADEVFARTGLRPVPLSAGRPSMGWHGNALLLREGIELTDLRELDLPTLEPRGAVLASLSTPAGPLHVVAAHLGLTKRHRMNQTLAIRAALDRLTDAPAIIMGDFNEWRSVGGLAPLMRDFEVLSPGRSFHAARPIAALDRFALGRGVDLLAAGVRQDGPALRASDHLPIWADVALTPAAERGQNP